MKPRRCYCRSYHLTLSYLRICGLFPFEWKHQKHGCEYKFSKFWFTFCVTLFFCESWHRLQYFQVATQHDFRDILNNYNKWACVCINGLSTILYFYYRNEAVYIFTSVANIYQELCPANQRQVLIHSKVAVIGHFILCFAITCGLVVFFKRMCAYAGFATCVTVYTQGYFEAIIIGRIYAIPLTSFIYMGEVLIAHIKCLRTTLQKTTNYIPSHPIHGIELNCEVYKDISMFGVPTVICSGDDYDGHRLPPHILSLSNDKILECFRYNYKTLDLVFSRYIKFVGRFYIILIIGDVCSAVVDGSYIVMTLYQKFTLETFFGCIDRVWVLCLKIFLSTIVCSSGNTTISQVRSGPMLYQLSYQNMYYSNIKLVLHQAETL